MNTLDRPQFSVVLIARNESKTLPRLVESLKEFQSRLGEIVLVDTGSTDDTAQVAFDLGCRVLKEGNRFQTRITFSMAQAINKRFIVKGENGILTPGEDLFDYATARNYAASMASNDMVAMPDCDEVFTKLDLDKINAAIVGGLERFEYNFVFSHDRFGNDEIKFLHSKFYDRRKMKWAGVVHEVLQGKAETKFFPEEVIKLEHYQNVETNRSGYLRGLALDCYQNPDNDRNSHYFARDLLWNGRPRSAIKEFNRHIAMNKWPAERGQSMIYIGDAHLKLKGEEAALQSYHRAFLTDGTRREALIRLAEYCIGKSDWQRAACYAQAALAIPWNNFYANRLEHYRHMPHELLYQSLWWLGDKEGSEVHWKKALEFQPLNSKYLHHARFYHKLPKVSIVIPTLGRGEKLVKLVELLENKDFVNHPNYEVIVEHDSFENRQGVAKTLKKGVERATGELICFLGNDCVPQQDFLIHAALSLPFPGLVAFNDGLWNGTLATHWLASKALLEQLDGEFFHTGYHHVGCDNELTARVKKLGCYCYCPEAKIHHPIAGELKDEVSRLAWDPILVARDRELLKERSQKLGFELV